MDSMGPLSLKRLCSIWRTQTNQNRHFILRPTGEGTILTESSTDQVFKQQWSKYLTTSGAKPHLHPRLHLQMGLILFSTFLVQPIGRFPTNTVLFVFTFSSAFLLLSFCLFSTHFSTSFSPSGSAAFLFFFAGVSFPRSSSSAFSKLISLQEKKKKKNDPCYSRTKDN